MQGKTVPVVSTDMGSRRKRQVRAKPEVVIHLSGPDLGL